MYLNHYVVQMKQQNLHFKYAQKLDIILNKFKFNSVNVVITIWVLFYWC